MNDMDVMARTLPLPFGSGRHRSVAIAAVVTVVALFLGGCDGGESPQELYPPGGVYDNGGNVYDDGYSYDDGGIDPNEFDPPPAQGPYSPGLNSPYN
ncbi:MAG: hypothetical protein LC808_18225 [Actinobacteria bacterium]|nr:hypothetical protein [Actinomycetota bacterium]